MKEENHNSSIDSNGNEIGTKLLIALKTDSANHVSCDLQLEVVDVVSNPIFPVGLALKTIFRNNTQERLFLNFEPVHMKEIKDGDDRFYLSIDPTSVPGEVTSVIGSSHCFQKPKQELINSLCDSVFHEKNYLRNPEGMGIMFCNSFLFLDPGETFECSQSIAYILKSNEGRFANPGKYEFIFLYDASKSPFSPDYEAKIPDVFSGYKRYKGQIISNAFIINVRK